MKAKLASGTKFLLLILAAGLILVLFTPIWRIELNAPQYPEGLSLQIHAKGLRGNVDIINGLNHYIGMKTLHNEDFIEFKILPYCIIFFSLLFITTFLINRRWCLNMAFIFFFLFGVIAMYDFWKWEYDYGHNLNPDAAIKVPGMAYQPPLIGFKQLLNFGAYSIPDTGGWIFIAVGLLLFALVVIEWRRTSSRTARMTRFGMATILIPAIFGSCNSVPEVIVAGTDHCSFCKMTISDIKYAGELVTRKGKLYKFDDLHCMQSFRQSNSIDEKEIKETYISNFSVPNQLLKTSEALFLKGGTIRAPMNGNIIAFKEADSLSSAIKVFSATQIRWEEIDQ